MPQVRSHENEKHVTGNRETTLKRVVGQKTELAGYLAKISKQYVKGMLWFLLIADGKIRERGNLKELLSKRKPAFEDMEKNLRLSRQNADSREPMGVAGQSLDINGRPTMFLRIFYQQKYCQAGPKGSEIGQNEE